jgi:uncharacterized protein (TIGR03086 family)
MDLRPLYFTALENTGRIVAGIKPDQLDGGTPCEGWSTRDLANHIVGGVLLFERALAGEKTDPNQKAPELIGDDPGSAFENARKLSVDAWSAPDALERTINVGNDTPATGALRIALMEAVVHGWDLAKATGQDHGIDPMTATAMLDGLKKMLGEGPRPEGGPFAQPVSVPDDAPIQEQLVAFLGRTP